VLQSTLAAPSDPPVRSTPIVLTPRFSTAPAVAEDIDIVPADVPAAFAAEPPLKVAPKKDNARDISETKIPGNAF
jgi:hypothetical protein